jgi:hypothetical protein
MKLFGGPKVGGLIKSYRLDKWWRETLTSSERDSSAKRFPDAVNGSVPAEQAGSIAQFLWSWATHFKKAPEDRVIARKMLNLAVEQARVQKRILDEHFALQGLIEVWYRDRDLLPEAFDQAIAACEAQIAIAAEAARAFRHEYKNHPMPVPRTHRGYEQLRIIREKQKRYDDAIALALDKQRTGWDEDVSEYVAEMNHKKSKLSNEAKS